MSSTNSFVTESSSPESLDSFVSAQLACPRCHGKLTAACARFECPACRLAYPVLDGIAVLIAERAEGI